MSKVPQRIHTAPTLNKYEQARKRHLISLVKPIKREFMAKPPRLQAEVRLVSAAGIRRGICTFWIGDGVQ
ncbi:MAG TPA: hypothetical protein VMW75_27845 [Thermoanaerobaculia bacterium]|nr:hypothetical protein [Thermoanaerobaculia bacterium]